MKRLMISAMQSGSGKTTVTCGLLAALKKRGVGVQAFKCGPDYIDPMFHSRVLGVPSRNLDMFLQGERGVLNTLNKQTEELAVLEGAMGYYDGLGGTDRASAWAVSALADIPTVLVVRPKGSSLTLAAQLMGMLNFRENSNICGVIFTDCSPMLYAHLQSIVERETPLRVFGYLPPMSAAELGSRHLGLLTAAEITDFTARFEEIAEQMEKTVDVDTLISAAGDAAGERKNTAYPAPRCKIAVARDEAFCFYYEDNLDALRAAGAEIEFFSPLHDAALPQCGGLYLGGGYPELYAAQLSANTAMLAAVKAAVNAGLPTVAECGGFMYLGAALEGDDGISYPMASVLPGSGVKTPHLQRFGYAEITSENPSLLFAAGEKIPVHEFHYWDSTDNGTFFAAAKPDGRMPRRCGFASDTLYAAFPHLHFGGAVPMAQRFADAAERFEKNERIK